MQQTPIARLFLYEDCIIETIFSIWQKSFVEIKKTENFAIKFKISISNSNNKNREIENSIKKLSMYNNDFKKENNKEITNNLNNAYNHLLANQEEIEFMWSNSDLQKNSGMKFEEFCNNQLSHAIKDNKYFIDIILPTFFRLLASTMELNYIRSSPRGIPPNKETRLIRSSKAARVKNSGQETLKEYYSNYFKTKKPETKFKSLAAVLATYSDDLESIFNEYIDLMRMESKENGNKTFFGHNLYFFNILNTIRRWIKEDEEFHKVLQDLCQKPISTKKSNLYL